MCNGGKSIRWNNCARPAGFLPYFFLERSHDERHYFRSSKWRKDELPPARFRFGKGRLFFVNDEKGQDFAGLWPFLHAETGERKCT